LGTPGEVIVKGFSRGRNEKVGRELIAAFISEKSGKCVAIAGGVYPISVQDFLGFCGICLGMQTDMGDSGGGGWGP
jgi:hypothetical protein